MACSVLHRIHTRESAICIPGSPYIRAGLQNVKELLTVQECMYVQNRVVKHFTYLSTLSLYPILIGLAI